MWFNVNPKGHKTNRRTICQCRRRSAVTWVSGHLALCRAVLCFLLSLCTLPLATDCYLLHLQGQVELDEQGCIKV